MVDLEPARSWLFAPGHDEKLLGKVFDAGADEVLLDLEDGVPYRLKGRARGLVGEVLADKPCWVRVNRARTAECEDDLAAVAGRAVGLRVPKVESAADVAWVEERAAGLPLDCTVETALGVLNAFEIASAPACRLLSFGGLDLAADVGSGTGDLEMLYARSALVIAARSAGKPQPSDGVHVLLNDDAGLRRETEAAKSLGFFGKSAIHPRQLPIIHDVFTPSARELEWARGVLEAFEVSGEAATRTKDGEFVDLPVAQRARRILRLAGLRAGRPRG